MPANAIPAVYGVEEPDKFCDKKKRVIREFQTRSKKQVYNLWQLYDDYIKITERQLLKLKD